MADPESPLKCYRCATPAALDDAICRTCEFPLDWAAIADLRSLDYLRMRIEQWQREGALFPTLANRLLAEVRQNREKLLALLVEPKPKPEPEPEPAYTPPGPEPQPAPWPESRPEAPREPPPPPAPARRPVLEVLLDLGTVRLMLYTGALMLAVGTMIWLRDALRVQLQRPVVQASLLGLLTFAALAGGAALVVRARERAEQRLIGRGILFLGSLLLPLNPWFWLQTGLIEDRGNGWIVGLISFALSTIIALGLGDRVFVYMSYAGALLTGWLLTFKLTGGAAPGAYALVLALISGAYLHAERAVESRQREGWEKLGSAFFLAGHIGVLFTLLFYTNVVRALPPELLAAFRHFDASGYTPWVGVAVSLLAAEAYLYSAWRRADARFTYFGAAAAFWSAALALFAADVPPGAWLFACGAAALATWALGTALAREPLWGPPLRAASRALAWTGFVFSIGAAIALVGGIEVRWFTAAGIAFLAVVFALDATARDRESDAFPVPILGLLLLLYLLRLAGVDWVYTNAVLALAIAAVPFLSARLLGGREGARTGVRYASTAATIALALVGIGMTVAVTEGGGNFRLIPFAAAMAVALGAHGWHSTTAAVRYPMYAAAALFLQLATALVAAGLETKYGFSDRSRPFVLVPFAYALASVWALLRRAQDERVAEISHVARAGASGAAVLAALTALPILFDSFFDPRAYLLFSLAMAAAAPIPLGIAAAVRAGAAAMAEGSLGWLLALTGYVAFAIGVADRFPNYNVLTLCTIVGLAPLLFVATRDATAARIPALSAPADVIGGAVSALLLLPLVVMTGALFTTPAPEGEGIAAAGTLGALLVAHALWRAAASPLQRIWSAKAAVAALATYSVGLHALGLRTAEAQAEPFALLLVVAMAAAAFLPAERARDELWAVSHGAMILLVAAVVGLRVGFDTSWSSLDAARLALEVSVFYALSATRRDGASVVAAVASGIVSLLFVCDRLGVTWPSHAVLLAVIAAVLVVRATGLGERFAWMRVPLTVSGHGLFLLTLAATAATLPLVLGVGDPRLGRYVVAAAALAASAWVIDKFDAQVGAFYPVAWRALAAGTYVLLGLWLGFHPWRDSAFYTLPAGIALVALGVWWSRRGERTETAWMLWLGSLLAAAPMLLHALENRFVLGVSPIGYDAATLSVGLGLALVGVAFQLRAPSIVGGAAFAADLFVVAFSKVRWEEIPLSIYVATLGGLLFLASWLLLYRRDELLRLREFLRTRREAFQQWR